MPNSEPSTQELRQYLNGSRQKRAENLQKLVDFLQKWKTSGGMETNTTPDEIATRFCHKNFDYGYVTRRDIVEHALIKSDLFG